MSKNFILVPENMFKSQFPNKENFKLDDRFVTKERGRKKKIKVNSNVDSILDNKKMDLSTRNALYNQNLVANMKHNQQVHNQAVPIKMESHPELYDDHIYVRRQDVLPSQDEEITNIPYSGDPYDDIELDDRHVTMTRGSGKSRKRASSSSPPPKRNKSLSERKKRFHKAAFDIFKLMLKQPDIYRITKDGRILKPSRKGIIDSSKPGDALKIVRELLGDHIGGYIPAGYERFKKDLMSTELAGLIRSERARIFAEFNLTGSGWLVSRSLNNKKLSSLTKVDKRKKGFKKNKKIIPKRIRLSKESIKYENEIEKVLKWPRRN